VVVHSKKIKQIKFGTVWAEKYYYCYIFNVYPNYLLLIIKLKNKELNSSNK